MFQRATCKQEKKVYRNKKKGNAVSRDICIGVIFSFKRVVHSFKSYPSLFCFQSSKTIDAETK